MSPMQDANAILRAIGRQIADEATAEAKRPGCTFAELGASYTQYIAGCALMAACERARENAYTKAIAATGGDLC